MQWEHMKYSNPYNGVEYIPNIKVEKKLPYSMRGWRSPTKLCA